MYGNVQFDAKVFETSFEILFNNTKVPQLILTIDIGDNYNISERSFVLWHSILQQKKISH